MNNRLKINLIKERTLQRKNELEGKQNTTEAPFFANNNKVFSTTQNTKEQYYQNYNQFPQNVDTNLLTNNINENFIRPMPSDGQEMTSPIQPMNSYQAYPYQQQQLQQQAQQQIPQFTQNPTVSILCFFIIIFLSLYYFLKSYNNYIVIFTFYIFKLF